MIKSFLTVLIISFLVTPPITTSQTENLEWFTWDDGYAKGKKTNKIILIDMYTDWCGWCKRMDHDTYAKPEIIKLINKDFIPIKFNPEKKLTYDIDGSKITGRQLAGLLANNRSVGYPTTFFLFPKLRKVYLESGYQNAERFKQTLIKYKDLKIEEEKIQKETK